MKRYLVLAVLFIALFPLSAQRYPKGALVKFWNRGCWQGGAEAGPALTSIWGGQVPVTLNVNYTAGIFFRYNFLQWMAIQTGFNIERVGRSQDFIFKDLQYEYNANVKTRLDFVTIPVLFGFDVINRRCNLNFTLGGFISYLFKAEETVRVQGTSSCPPQTYTTTNDDFNRINAGITGGIGLDYQFIFGLKLGCEIRDQLGLVHLMRYQPISSSYRTNSLQLLGRVSYRF